MPVRILHCHSTFSLGGKEARAVRLMNAWSDRAEHVILSAVPGALGARDAIAPDIKVDFPSDAPSLQGRPGLARYRMLARYMAGFDLVLTYNWGAMDAVMTRRLLGGPPLVHHEDGFNDDEARRQKPRRILFRRLALPAARALVVPSATLERIARRTWRQPSDRLRRIPNGIDLGRIDPGAPAHFPALHRQPGEVQLVTVAGLRAVKGLPAMVSRLAELNRHIPARLTILGEGPERAAIEAQAQADGVADRVHLPGFVADPGRVLPHFDIFLITSLSEQFPISLVEAMAAGLPCVSTDVGDVREMLSPANAVHVASAPAAFGSALHALAQDPDLRRTLGAANRVKALADYDEARMIASYAALYGGAIGLRDAFQE